MKRLLSYIFLIFCIIADCAAQCPIRFTGNNHAQVGIYIEEIATGKKLADYNSETSMTPASILKCVTCATALNILGPDFRFATEFFLVGPSPREGVAEMIVKASADPTTGSREFPATSHLPDSISFALKNIGINYIGGGIRIDGAILPDSGGIVPQWEVEDISHSYGVGLYPVNWYDNYFQEDLIIPDPPHYFRQLMMENFNTNEIDIDEKYVAADSIPGTNDTLFVYRHFSPSAKQIMRSLMVRSDNLMAEGILRAIRPYEHRDSAIWTMRNHWINKGIDLEFSRILDGNGLARGNSISARQIGKILTSMTKSGYCDVYLQLFPLAGKQGTVARFLKGTRLEERLLLKSGTMSGVHCYAGYLLNKKGGKPTHTVVIMVNNFYCNRNKIRKAIESYLLNKLP